MYLAQAKELFIADRKINGCAAKTIEFYHYTLSQFLSFIGEDIELSDLPQHIPRYFLALQERNLSQASVHTSFRGIRAF